VANKKNPVRISRELAKCSDYRKREIACSLYHEKRVWPEASRIRVFMLIPSIEYPHFCAQCEDYLCAKACPFNTLSISDKTGAVKVKNKARIASRKGIDAYPSRIPHIHPLEKHVVICDLCEGHPQRVKVCQEGKWNVLETTEREDNSYKLYARTPEETTKNLAIKFYREQAEEYMWR